MGPNKFKPPLRRRRIEKHAVLKELDDTLAPLANQTTALRGSMLDPKGTMLAREGTSTIRNGAKRPPKGTAGALRGARMGSRRKDVDSPHLRTQFVTGSGATRQP